MTFVQVSGTYGTVTFVLEGTIDSTNWFAVAAFDESTGILVTGSIAPTDNTTAMWKIPSEGLSGVRLRTTAVGSGTLAVTMQSAAYGALPYFAGAVSGQTLAGALTVGNGNNFVLGTSTGTKFGTATSQKLGFFNVTPVVQPVASADVTSFVAGSGTASKSDSTWTGASGSSAYTVGGIVTALKALGLLAA